MAGRPKKIRTEDVADKLAAFESENSHESKPKKKEENISLAQEFKIDGMHFKRHLDFHSQNSHASHGHAPIFSLNDSMFNLPKALREKNSDYICAFIPIEGRGNNNDPYGGLDEAVNKYWWPIDRSEDPELSRRYFNIAGRNHDANLIKYKGQVAMKRLKTIHEQEMEMYNKLNQKNEELKKNMTLFDDGFKSPSPSLAPKERHTVIV
jgi:hypothetical protein